MLKIGIVDYGMGNIRSLMNALTHVKECEVLLSNDSNVLEKCDGLILPGVGAYLHAMENLKQNNLIDTLKKLALIDKKPLLSICLGMQLLFESSEEGGEVNGLGIIPGQVKRFDLEESLRIPHMGWNEIIVENKNSILFQDIPEDQNFYFVHSYYVSCDDKYVLARCNYGKNFVCMVQSNNVIGVQFHPEKSQKTGLALLKNFLEFTYIYK